ncbi:pyridoxamine 5'-phosphate oxidase family protein [Knoellia subterranea]|uniref:Pyridoxamine 5'-phosphate oxidase n=1 Tax=Knoellia subterranea KCTC 19937 TaxID=1385521 RepID=A0A0A0JLY0_9MICO|nr:pyridoxamine 5'-phosphate oxidase family protein [Knoellia subterranea]KGN37017.1 pyridoxamine 5'-phosphate oxidase [Knoellia subterranea KCTC 19937]
MTHPAPSRPPGPLHSLNRHKERGSTERAALDAILDDVLAGTLSTVVDGEPWVVPMLFARQGDRILLHGSTGAGALRHVAAGAPAALAVISVDALVVGHTTFDSSANYRSAVVRGALTPLSDDERPAALDALSERILPGRNAEVRPMTRQEQAKTLVMALPITDDGFMVKTRTGTASAPDEETDAWHGVVELRTVALEPQPAPTSSAAKVPESVREFAAARVLA